MPGAFNAADWYSLLRCRRYGLVEKKNGRLLFTREGTDFPEDHTDAFYGDRGPEDKEPVAVSHGIEI